MLRRLVRAAESRPFHPLLPFWTASWVSGVRFLAEKAFVYDARPAPMNVMGAVLSWVSYYLALCLCMAALVRVAAKIDWKRSLQAVSFGLVLAVLPPFIDILIYGRGHFSYRYQVDFAPSLSLLFFDAQKGLPLGEGLVVWGGIALVGSYVFVQTGQPVRAFWAAAGQYMLGLIFGAGLPAVESVLGALPGANALGDNWIMAWLCLGVAFLGYLLLRPQLIGETFKRFPQIVLAPAVTFLGASVSGQKDIGALVAAVAFGGVAAVFALTNLFYDHREDIGRRGRVDADDVGWLYAWSAILCLTMLRHHTELALCLMLFLFTAHAYHADPLRLKCLFPAAYKAEGMFAASAFLGGIVVHTSYRMQAHDIWGTALIFGGFSLSASFKDSKDIAGDTAAGVRTLYVVLADWSFARVHLISTGLLLGCLLVPPAVLAILGKTPLLIAVTAALAVLAAGAPWLKDRRLGVALAVTLIAIDLCVIASGTDSG